VADVSGKGMPAALLMSHMQATLRALLGRCRSLPSLATQASDLLFASSAGNKYVTAAFLDLDLQSGAARYVSAGHVDCLLIRADGETVRLCSTGAPLGLLPPGLPYDEVLVTVAPGDCLVLYSDGVADARSDSGDEFGDERLLDLLVGSRTQPASVVVDRVFESIDRFAAGAPQFDDITILVLRRAAA
jgi:sigma-B regulation protein RsbU (phosphoserine phosphatase)